ncbi:hypothetical protein [Mariniflexile sp. HMF6888]|uniref:hypothetical protein n=1 Tax=Mariniflexile sp. HMF6888 TaxID=3373086 RepID=UPI0037AF1CBC
MAFGTDLLIGLYARRQSFIHAVQEVVEQLTTLSLSLKMVYNFLWDSILVEIFERGLDNVNFALNKKSSQHASAQVPLSQFMKINLI